MKCDSCGHENLERAKFCEMCGTPMKKKINFRELIDEYAHYANYTTVETGEDEAMKKDLLTGGPEVVDMIVDYLIQCGLGNPAIESYWWNNAASLVRIIKEFPNIDYESKYQRLISLNTNIWEYHTQIKNVASEELHLLKKKNSPKTRIISAADAGMELQLLERRYRGKECIEKAKEMESSVDNWSDEAKAFYYYIIAHCLKFDLKMEDETPYAYYAAQVYYNPIHTSLGWLEIRRLEEFNDLKPSPENAKIVHERFPLPKSLDELNI